MTNWFYARHTLSLMAIVLIAANAVHASGPYTAGDFLSTKRVTAAEISPNGKWIAYTVETMRPARDKAGASYQELFMVSTATREIRPFIVWEERVGSVAWRPDGSALTFLARRRDNRESQVWLIPVDGGEARQVTNSETEIYKYAWSPDGKRLAYNAVSPPSTKEKMLKDAGYEFIYYEENLRHRNLYIADVDEAGNQGTVHQLTDDITVWSFEFAPDGKTLAMGASPQNLVDHEYMFQHIHLVDVATKSRRQLTNNPGKLGNFAFSPDGSVLAYNGAASRNDHRESQVFVIPVAGGSERNLTIPRFRGHVQWVGWRDKNTVLYRSAEGVHTTISSVSTAGGGRQVLLNSERTGVVFSRTSMTAGMKQLALVGESASIPGDVYHWTNGRLDRLTNVNPWLAERSFGAQEVIRYAARDGLEIEGLLIHPVGYRKGERYPLIVVVHGGPEAHYSNGWLTTYGAPGQVLAGKGYVVFYPNYRASTGYGVEFAAQGFGDPAGKEFDDIADGIDYLVAQAIADKQRVGLGGGSYGGYASAWFATFYTQYIRAVCMFVGISNNVSRVGTTDIPWEEYYVHSGKHIEEMWEFALERSPIFHAHRSRTATLIMGGTADTRVDPSQSMELYRRMKMNNHPAVRLVQYPGERHGNARQPGRIDVLYRTLDWYDWYVRDLKPLDGPMPPLDISITYGLDLPAETVSEK